MGQRFGARRALSVVKLLCSRYLYSLRFLMILVAWSQLSTLAPKIPPEEDSAPNPNH